MAQKSGFFDSKNGDRTYLASFFAKYFSNFLTNGIFNGGTNLQVTAPGTDLNSRLAIGDGYINGYTYENDAELQLAHPTADPTLDRIDRVVLRMNLNEDGTDARSIKAFVLTGTPAASPVVPALTRAGAIYELSMAQVLVQAGVTTISDIDITDERLDNNVCGLVNSLIQADTTDIFNQFQTFFDATVDEWDTWFSATQAAWTAWFNTTQSDWSTFFAGAMADLFRFGPSTTGNDDYVTTISGITSYTDGLWVIFKPDTANTGPATLNVNSLGAKSIVLTGDVSLSNQDILGNTIVFVAFNATLDKWELKFGEAADTFNFDNWSDKPGLYYLALKNTPSTGDWTEEIRETAGDALFASRINLKNNPSTGDWNIKLTVASLGIQTENQVFKDNPGTGDFRQNISTFV